jgi:hypothetical protein
MRKKITAIVAIGAAFLAVAGYHLSAIGAGPTIASSPSIPIVDIQADGKTIKVTPDPLIFQNGEGPVKIRWQIPSGSSLTFDDKATGIEIHGEIVFDKGTPKVDKNHNEFEPCEVEKDLKVVVCKNKHTRPGYFKYNLHLKLDGKPITVDPTILNG